MSRETKFVLGLLSAWFCLALASGVSGMWQGAGALAIGFTVWGLAAVALLICWIFHSASEFVAAADLKWLIVPHLARFVGIYFLVLAARGNLPAGFAKPAGIGDIVIATVAVAMLLLTTLRRRQILFVWNVVGLIDIAFVAFSALYFGSHDWAGMAPLREFPLILLPTFFVPLIIASHVLIFVLLGSVNDSKPTGPAPVVASVLKR